MAESSGMWEAPQVPNGPWAKAHGSDRVAGNTQSRWVDEGQTEPQALACGPFLRCLSHFGGPCPSVFLHGVHRMSTPTCKPDIGGSANGTVNEVTHQAGQHLG